MDRGRIRTARLIEVSLVRQERDLQTLCTWKVCSPKRKLVQNSRLPIIFGAPYGDNMMTGTTGMLEAIRRRKYMEPMTYL